MNTKLPELEDDGLITPEVGDWSEDKYRLVALYSKMFATAMKDKWDCRVYIDLFAGAGRARIRNTARIIPASPLLALSIPDQFDRHIFCDKDGARIQALKERISREYPNANAEFLVGDTNAMTDEVLASIPRATARFKVLCFCFADPYNLENLAFDTIRRLADRFIDFLILIPSYMDAHRNVSGYIRSGDQTVERFLGLASWREEWKQATKRGQPFGIFLADRFGSQMNSLRYIYSGVERMVEVHSTEKNLPLYHLAFFSRHKLGEKFWKEAQKYSTPQRSLFD